MGGRGVAGIAHSTDHGSLANALADCGTAIVVFQMRVEGTDDGTVEVVLQDDMITVSGGIAFVDDRTGGSSQDLFVGAVHVDTQMIGSAISACHGVVVAIESLVDTVAVIVSFHGPGPEGLAGVVAHNLDPNTLPSGCGGDVGADGNVALVDTDAEPLGVGEGLQVQIISFLVHTHLLPVEEIIVSGANGGIPGIGHDTEVLAVVGLEADPAVIRQTRRLEGLPGGAAGAVGHQRCTIVVGIGAQVLAVLHGLHADGLAGVLGGNVGHAVGGTTAALVVGLTGPSDSVAIGSGWVQQLDPVAGYIQQPRNIISCDIIGIVQRTTLTGAAQKLAGGNSSAILGVGGDFGQVDVRGATVVLIVEGIADLCPRFAAGDTHIVDIDFIVFAVDVGRVAGTTYGTGGIQIGASEGGDAAARLDGVDLGVFGFGQTVVGGERCCAGSAGTEAAHGRQDQQQTESTFHGFHKDHNPFLVPKMADVFVVSEHVRYGVAYLLLGAPF